MGVRHAREYSDILTELTDAVGQIEDCYSFFEMESDEWKALDEEEKKEVLEALADDVFFALGDHNKIEVGSGVVWYKPQHHIIEVIQGNQVSRIVRLV